MVQIANLSVLSPGKWMLDMFGKNIFRPIFDFFAVSTFFQKIRSGPLTLARQGSISAGAPNVLWSSVVPRCNVFCFCLVFEESSRTKNMAGRNIQTYSNKSRQKCVNHLTLCARRSSKSQRNNFGRCYNSRLAFTRHNFASKSCVSL